MRPPDYSHIEERRVQQDGTTRCYQFFKCSCCDATLDYAINGKRKPPDQLAKLARKKGWEIDLKHGRHVCPAHTEEGTMTKTARPSETPPREMTREDKRTIFREIDDSYDAANGRYVFDVTDESISKKLNVPRAWVASIREDSFGPAGPDPEIVALRKEAAALAVELDDAETTVLKATELVENLSKSLAAIQTKLDRLVSKA